MESWSLVSGGGGGKGCVANEIISASDSSARSRNALMGWELKTPHSFVSNVNMLVSGEQGIESLGFGGFGIQEVEAKRLPSTNNSMRDDLSAKVGVDIGVGVRVGRNNIMNPFMPTPNSNFGEDESNSSSKLSSSMVDSNSSRDSSLIDLKLGRFSDQTQRVANHNSNSKISRVAPTPKWSSSESCTPPKRARVAALSSHAVYCQVYGCNKDLTSSKDYHKRHKVCEVHSKTAKVIVNGIEQRFCQQCSRFHLLAEFDDGKRSCRKRLAGHNERRRKPQVGMHSGSPGKLLPSYNAFPDNRYQGRTLVASSFICQDILPHGTLHHEKFATDDWCKRIKPEHRTDHNPLSSIPIANGNLLSKSLFPHHIEKAVPSFHDNGVSPQYTHDMGGPNSGSSPFFQDASIESEDFTAFDTASTIHGISGISDSACALSLLSSKPQDSASNLLGIPLTRHLVMTGNNNHYSLRKFSEKLIGISSQASTSVMSNKFFSSGMNSVEGGNLANITVSHSSDSASFDVSNRIYEGSDCMNTKDRLSCEDGATIDLLQLSSQLQRVEHQRQSMQVKHESDAFCCL